MIEKRSGFRTKLDSFISALSAKVTPFFYSDVYLALLAVFVYVSWVTNQPVIGLLAISLFGTIALLATPDLAPTMPLLIMACCIFATDNIASYLIYITALIPLILAVVFHLIYYPPVLTLGKMFLPQVAISVALLVAGCTSIDSESYSATLGYVLLLGVLILVVYVVYGSYYRKNAHIKNSTYFAKTMLYFGLLMCLQIVTYYIRNGIGIDNLNQGWINLGWGIDNNVATLLLITAPMCFYLSFAEGKKQSDNFKKKFGWLYCVAGLIQYATIVLTFSRGGIVFAVLTAPFVLGFTIAKSKNKLNCIIPLCIAIVGVLAFYVVFFDKINGYVKDMFANIVSGDSLAGWANRDKLYLEACECFRNHPLFGAGIGYRGDNFEISAVGFYWFHSTFFQVIGSMGLVGLAAYAYFYAVRYKIIGAKVKKNAFSLFALIALIGFELYSMIDTGTFIPVPIMALVMLLNLIVERENTELEGARSNELMCEVYSRERRVISAQNGVETV